MKLPILSDELKDFLNSNAFVSMATCDIDMQPNVAPKFFLKVKDDNIYLADYNIDRTWANINFNPKVSLSVINLENLVGYQINGFVEVLDSEALVNRLLKEFGKKKIFFSTKRIIADLHTNKAHKDFELCFPDRVIIYRVKVLEVIEIKPSGLLEQRLAE